MKRIILLGITLSCFFLSACATFPREDIKISTEAEPKVNFNGYKTYTLLGSAGVILDPEGKWKPNNFDFDAEIIFLINKELRDQNILESNNNPDLIVTYVLGINMAALKGKIDPKTKINILQNVPQGGLVVVLIDAQSGFVIWGAIATAEIKNLKPDLAKKRLEYAISQMFDQLPK